MDPANKICPDYEADEWEIVWQALITGHQNQAEPLNNKGAILQLKVIWQAQHDRKIAQWNQEREEDQAVEDECIRQEGKEEEQNKEGRRWMQKGVGSKETKTQQFQPK